LNSNNIEINPYAIPTSSKSTTNSYTQLESEINLVCMGHWRHENNIVIVSRTMTNEMLCSVSFGLFIRRFFSYFHSLIMFYLFRFGPCQTMVDLFNCSK
jgi:hypothetical protein